MKKHPDFAKAVVLIITIIGIFLIIINTVQQPVQTGAIEEKPAEIHKLGEELTEEETIEEVAEEPIQEEIEAIVEEPVFIEEEIKPVEEKPIVTTIISDEKCENGVISLNLNNLFDDPINVAWSTFFVSGKIVQNSCDKKSLDPGESAFCSNVGSFPRKGKIRVAVAIYKHTTVGVTVDCSSNLVTGSAVEEVPYYGFSPVFFVAMLFLLLFAFNYYRVHY